MRWCREDTSIKVPADGWFPLFGPCRKSSACPEPVQFCKPFVHVREHGLEKNPFLNSAHPHLVPFKTELLRETDGLAAAVFEQFCGLSFRHFVSIYQ